MNEMLNHWPHCFGINIYPLMGVFICLFKLLPTFLSNSLLFPPPSGCSLNDL